jgi:hypothetical protein
MLTTARIALLSGRSYLFISTVISFLILIMLPGCSDPGSDYLGTWTMRGQPITINISKDGNIYQVSGSFAFQGGYVLDDEDRLVNSSIDNTRFTYNSENDVLVWAGNDNWSRTEVFERAPVSEQNTQTVEEDNGPVVVPAPTPPQVVDTNKLVGRWKAQYDYYAYTMTVYLDISNGVDSCDEYHCMWSAQDNTGGNRENKTWCAHMNTGILEAHTKMGGRATTMSAFKNGNDRALSVIFAYNSSEILPWRLEFIKQ